MFPKVFPKVNASDYIEVGTRLCDPVDVSLRDQEWRGHENGGAGRQAHTKKTFDSSNDLVLVPKVHQSPDQSTGSHTSSGSRYRSNTKKVRFCMTANMGEGAEESPKEQRVGMGLTCVHFTRSTRINLLHVRCYSHVKGGNRLCEKRKPAPLQLKDARRHWTGPQ